MFIYVKSHLYDSDGFKMDLPSPFPTVLNDKVWRICYTNITPRQIADQKSSPERRFLLVWLTECQTVWKLHEWQQRAYASINDLYLDDGDEG